MFITSNFIAALMGASMVNAHMIMSVPVPYSKDSLNNSPLAADGSDFPCKLRDNAFEAPETETIIAIGESHPLSFIGSATHGGGSCQISLTTDLQPSKTSEWKVIKSFEGGCPANVDGNMSGGADVVDPYSFNFTIPDGISAGKYTLAWTWFNRIGNREMYMNCAPITVSGGSSKRSPEEFEKRAASFPPMFVANVNGCTTPESVDIRFPQPGDDIEYDGEPANLAAEGSEACTGTATFGGSAITASSSSSSSGSESGSSSSVASSSSTSAPAESASTAATTVSAAPVPEATSSSAPVDPEPVASSTTAAAPATSSSSSGSTSGALTGSCSTEGEWNCISGTSFQRCASGTWSAAQQMATGTACNAGQSEELVISASKKARHLSSMRFRNRAFGVHHAHSI
ncbi:CAZyme family AA11 [Penicillium roqueforti]|nr:CAZyme family AA11 [Penicillium roqueforti]KAI2670699.1 CAZyme family AA11 [Penicillium roqueforti]KAI2683283.1 CAZyme family AA11 [Penicillium roqueforti]KAI2701850.1 CAZyme family AA11 [Penicillium roqueforti]KAI2714586.1 CAZyme family AA11 [Penicillium roqueforti]